MVGITIGGVNALEPLRELDIADPVPISVQHEAHTFPHGLAVVYVVVAVQIQDEWTI